MQTTDTQQTEQAEQAERTQQTPRTEPQTWFVTGSSRGLGRALVRAALAAGDRVAATARKPEQLDDLVEEFGERIRPIRLDVTDPAAVRAALEEARTYFGRVDVLVNNAGYANVAPIETAEDADVRAQFETNFWGVYNVSKAAIPLLREQKGGGLVIQFSSMGGRVGGSPGIASYQAAKFAIDGFSRVLRAETAPFGVRVLVVEPSGFRTDWAGSSMSVQDVPEAYAETVGAMNARVRQSSGGIAGDPARAAEILVQVAKRRDIPEHLPLGVNAAEGSIAQDRRLLADDLNWRTVSRSADFAEPYPVPFPADDES
jgi:NAD(P)-dependent dehydrogenase (short-subunit alcohol dehydrogenase family)